MDGHYEGEGKDVKYVPLSNEELKELEEIVKGAVGFDPSRNDVVKVVNLPFYNSPVADVSLKTPVTEWLPGILTRVAAIGIVVFLFLLFKKSISRLLSSKSSYPAYIPSARVREGVSVPEYAGREPSIEDQTRELSKQDPEQVVKLVKTWLAEG